MKLFAGAATRLVPPHAVPSGALEDLLAGFRVSSVFVGENVANYRATPSNSTPPLIGIAQGTRGLPGRRSQALELSGACWVGSNVVPVALDADGVKLVAEYLVTSRVPRSSFFGPQREVLGIWDAVKDRWRDPFAVREEQPLLVLEDAHHAASRVEPHPEIRTAQPHEFSEVLPASVAMFEEEVGYSPLGDGETGYVRRVSRLIQDRRTYVLTRDARVIFKADVGAAHGDVCQIQGVWVAPDQRGRGLAAPCMSAVIEDLRRRWPTVSLYVNSYNLPALRTYHRVGFRQVGTFATVLF